MYFRSSLKLMAVVTSITSIGNVASQSLPPTIYNRICLPGDIAVPTSDCEGAIDKLANQGGFIDGPRIGCLEMVTYGQCSIGICVPASIRATAIAAAAQDIFSGCKPIGSNSNHVVAGTMQMNGFSTSTGGTGGELKITMGETLAGLSPRGIKDIVDTSPTRIHAKDLPVPHRVEARDPAPTWLINGGQFTLVVQDSQSPGFPVPSSVANALASNLRNNWGVQPANHNTAYDQQPMGSLNAAMGYYARNNHDLGDIDPTDRFPLAQGFNDFRNQQGNPGWFAVQVISYGDVVMGNMIFDVGGANML